MRSIEAIVDHDIRQFQAEQRESAPAPAPRPKVKTVQEIGQQLAQPKPMGIKPINLQTKRCRLCGGGKCKTCRLWTRISELSGLRKHGHNESRKMDFKYPLFGPMLVNEAHDQKYGRGKYKGLNKRDRNRCMRAALETIADMSNGHPGLPPWWIK